MTLHRKLLLFFLVQHTLFLLLAVVLSEFFIRPHNLSLEQKYAYEKISQIRNVFHTELEHLSLLATDWAVWDDTYTYMKEKNEEFLNSNFPDDILDSTKLTHIELFDVLGRSVFVKSEGTLDISGLLDHNGHLRDAYVQWLEERPNKDRNGVLKLEDKIVLVAFSPILRGGGEGPDRGTLMMVRPIDEIMLSKINKSTNSSVTLHSSDTFSSLETFDKHEFWIEEVDGQTLKINSYLNAPNGDISVVIETVFRREFVMESEKVIQYLFIFAGILGTASFVVSFYLLRSEVVTPLTLLGSHIVKIKHEGSLTESTLSQRKDEIGLLATEFNHLVRTIEEKNEVLAKVARIDALTGVANRMDFEERFEETRRQSCREEKVMTILLLDIDYFKKYNDTYGHVKGDEALVNVAAIIKHSLLRPHDYVARYGGEEFVLLLPDTDVEGSVIMAERIMENIQKLGIEHMSSENDEKVISVSIGCFSFVAHKGQTQEQLISMADEALYTAKEKGRNQYCVYERSDA